MAQRPTLWDQPAPWWVKPGRLYVWWRYYMSGPVIRTNRWAKDPAIERLFAIIFWIVIGLAVVGLLVLALSDVVQSSMGSV